MLPSGCPQSAIKHAPLQSPAPAHPPPTPAMMSVFTPVSLTSLGAPPGHPAGSLWPCLAHKQFFFGLNGVGRHHVLNFHEMPISIIMSFHIKKSNYLRWACVSAWPSLADAPVLGARGATGPWVSSSYRSCQALGHLKLRTWVLWC